ncbi:MAG: hypothetical protein ACP5RZ_00555 [Thermoplasmata archaeon]
MDLHSTLIFIIGLIFLSYASYHDIKTREIYSIVWFLMAVSGYILSMIYYSNGWEILTLMFIVISLWYFELMFYEYIIDIIIIIINFYLMLNTNNISFNIDLFLVIIYKYFYHINLMPGKADARAMMSLTLLSPNYSDGFGPYSHVNYVVNILFPYSLEILFYALILNAIIFGSYVAWKNHKNNVEISFTHLYENGEYKKYQTPFILSITLSFIISFFFSLFSIF